MELFDPGDYKHMQQVDAYIGCVDQGLEEALEQVEDMKNELIECDRMWSRQTGDKNRLTIARFRREYNRRANLKIPR